MGEGENARLDDECLQVPPTQEKREDKKDVVQAEGNDVLESDPNESYRTPQFSIVISISII